MRAELAGQDAPESLAPVPAKRVYSKTPDIGRAACRVEDERREAFEARRLTGSALQSSQLIGFGFMLLAIR